MKDHNQSSTTQRLTPQVSAIRHILGVGLLTLGLTACGGSGGGGSSRADIPAAPTPDPAPAPNPAPAPAPTPESNTTPPPATGSAFSQSATWVADGSLSEACYDIDTQQALSCDSDTWDIKLQNANRTIAFWTNSGVSGKGKGGAFYTMPWSELSQLTSAQDVPAIGFKADGGSGVFEANPWYEYDLNKQHQLAPNNRVYLISTDASDPSTESVVNKPVYALQIINYYDDAGRSGHPTVRWIDTALPSQVKMLTLDATSSEQWVYLNLATGETTTKDGDWQVGFRRYEVILNSGISGSGKVGGYLAKTPDGYYDDTGAVIAAAFMQDNRQASEAYLTAVSDYDVSPDGVPWVTDKQSSELNPPPTGSYPVIDFGWYLYDGSQGHRLFAKPEGERIGGLIRSAEGNSYARFYIEDIGYAENAAMPSTWTFKFDIQPAS